ncbi:hypothetical protein CB1_000757019 [Camelus ferus]|nr:hypothetical protein CB1_000757019 [Camelus ferus]
MSTCTHLFIRILLLTQYCHSDGQETRIRVSSWSSSSPEEWQRERKAGSSALAPYPMEQAATPGGRGLPCSLKQALALYQCLFRCPAGLGQLWAALQQVQEGQACPSGLELPTVLLQMERSRRAQEQLLWDLELLTGVGLGLFWPHRAQLCGLRGQGQCAWSQCSMPHEFQAVLIASC